MTLEKVLEKKIVQRAKELGFLTYKFNSPSKRGVPDRIFISSMGKLFFIEFKSSGGKLSELQKYEIDKLRTHGQTIYVVDNLNNGLNILYNAR